MEPPAGHPEHPAWGPRLLATGWLGGWGGAGRSWAAQVRMGLPPTPARWAPGPGCAPCTRPAHARASAGPVGAQKAAGAWRAWRWGVPGCLLCTNRAPGPALGQARCTGSGTRWAGGRAEAGTFLRVPTGPGGRRQLLAPPPPPRRLHPGRGSPAGTGEPLMWLGPGLSPAWRSCLCSRRTGCQAMCVGVGGGGGAGTDWQAGARVSREGDLPAGHPAREVCPPLPQACRPSPRRTAPRLPLPTPTPPPGPRAQPGRLTRPAVWKWAVRPLALNAAELRPAGTRPRTMPVTHPPDDPLSAGLGGGPARPLSPADGDGASPRPPRCPPPLPSPGRALCQ